MAAVNGFQFDDPLDGTAANDILNGFAGADTLRGLGGDDTLFGGWGNDALFGHVGDDVLKGAAGADVFVCNAGFGNDTVENFATAAYSNAHDTLRMQTGIGEAESHDAFIATTTQVGADVIHDPGGDGVNTITILNTFLGNLGAAFSSEHISSWIREPDAIRAFDDVRYIAYIRDPLEFIPQRRVRTCRAWLSDHDEPICRIFHPGHQLEHGSAELGPDGRKGPDGSAVAGPQRPCRRRSA
ncbi:hemolysin-type calcium-binding region [Citreicella sp. 357]|nr:hemolysin-type calcium-binding region [Citreicella sp. 357]